MSTDLTVPSAGRPPARIDTSGGLSAEDAILGVAVRYDPGTGQIEQSVSSTLALVEHLRRFTGGTYLFMPSAEGETAASHIARIAGYWVDASSEEPRLVPREPCPARLDGLVLLDLPPRCQIEIRQEGSPPTLYPRDEPELELLFEHPGPYRVRVLSARTLPGEFTVVAA